MNKLIFRASLLIAMCLFSASVYSQATIIGLTNSSGMVITSVNLAPAGTNTWGMNINTAGNIAVDRSIEFTQSIEKSSCVYDVRYTGEDGKYYYVQNVDLCKSNAIVLPNPVTNIDKTKTDKKPDDSKAEEIKPINDNKPVDDTKPIDSKPTDSKPTTDDKPAEK